MEGGLLDIRLSEHARRRAAERSTAPLGIQLVISLGEHIEGVHEGTREACIEMAVNPLLSFATQPSTRTPGPTK